jgi:protein gp37
MGKTGIEWTDATWNPLTGCSRVTAGCDNCYAFALHDMRYQAHLAGKAMPVQYHKPFSSIQLLPGRLEQPLHVRKSQRFFVNSMSDLFHSEVPDEYIGQVFEVMRQAHWHTFQILTKRAGRLRRIGKVLDWPVNVWMGVSVEFDNLVGRVDALREVPAAVRFLSCEPLLGPLPSLNLEGIHWVITGGESGQGARSCDPDWVRGIRDMCLAQNVAFFHKQWGGYSPKSGGRELDGRTWDDFPALREGR